MPNMFGGSSSDRDYAPHMYVLMVNGDPNDDNGYHYVGNAEASVRSEDIEYHVGLSTFSGLVCETMRKIPNTGYSFEPPIGIETTDIPQEVIREALKENIRQMGSAAGNAFVASLVAEAAWIPAEDKTCEMPEPTSFSDLFGSNEEKRQEYRQKQDAARLIAQALGRKWGVVDQAEPVEK
jgi:hypothetical protein